MAAPIQILRNQQHTKVRAHLSDDDVQRARDLCVAKIPDYLQSKIFITVRASERAEEYIRALPGMKEVGDRIGKKTIPHLGALVGVGVQIYDDWNRNDLTHAQKFARADMIYVMGLASIEIPPLGLALIAVNFIWPHAIDDAMTYVTSPNREVFKSIAAYTAKQGGPGLQQWIMKPKPVWVEFMLN